jgi:hypothetical protein
LAPRGWEELWLRDQCRQSELPHGDVGRGGGDVVLHYDGLVQPWLKEAAKRWVRARLLSSTVPSSMRGYLQHLQAFSGWLAERAPGVGSPAAVTRELLEDFMLAVRTSDLAGGTKWSRIAALRSFLEEQREDALAGLPRNATIYARQPPRPDPRLPRGIEASCSTSLSTPRTWRCCRPSSTARSCCCWL